MQRCARFVDRVVLHQGARVFATKKTKKHIVGYHETLIKMKSVNSFLYLHFALIHHHVDAAPEYTQ